MEHFHRFACLVLFAIWWGGLTLYSLVVVPIGTELFSATDQGFVTQLVTWRLNWIGAACLALLFSYLLRHPSRTGIATWGIMIVAALALFLLHRSLSPMLDEETRSIVNGDQFYTWHRYYLLVTAVQWLAGLVHLWTLCKPRPQPERAAA
jgi:hypothetical protein